MRQLHLDKTYLGDGVYVRLERGSILLTTENGEPDPTNSIVLEPEVYTALVRWVNEACAPPAGFRKVTLDDGSAFNIPNEWVVDKP